MRYGSGGYEGLAALVAKVGGSLAPAADPGTFDVAYEVLADRPAALRFRLRPRRAPV